MGLFDLFRRKSPARVAVHFDDRSVTCLRPGGLVETVLWSDLQSVIIKTTDQGPAVNDVYWILAAQQSGCLVPDEAEGITPLIERLQSLPGFDNHAMIEAMASTENREFVCWRL